MEFLYTTSAILNYTSVEIEVVERDEPELSGANIKYINAEGETNVFISAKAIFDNTGETSFKDCSTYYVVFANGGMSIVNKFAETFYTKQNGLQYIRSNNVTVPVQIYIPFASSDLSGATIRVSGPGVPTLGGEELDASKKVEATQEAFTECLWKLVPRITAPATSASPVSVQVTLDGQPLRKAGVKVVCKTADGVVSSSQDTNAQGVATFTADSGSTVEFGFRYYSNMASTQVL
jgi:hypothetical protein